MKSLGKVSNKEMDLDILNKVLLHLRKT